MSSENDRDAAGILLPARRAEVLASYDVIVAGGSPTGVAAAVAAARNGARVALVERFSFLGGQTTAGLMITFHRPFWDAHGNKVVGGLPVEMIARAIRLDGTPDDLESLDVEGAHYWDAGWTATAIDPEVTRRVMQEMLVESGVDVYLDVWISGTLLDSDRVRGVILEARSGPSALFGHVVVDATGDAHVAAQAGVDFQVRPNRFQPNLVGRMQGLDLEAFADYAAETYDEFDPHPPGLSVREYANLVRRGGVFGLIGFARPAARARQEGMALHPQQKFGFLHMREGMCMLWRNNLPQVDPLDVRQLSEAYLEGRKRLWDAVAFYRAYIPGMQNVKVVDTAVAMGVRETRRIVGQYVLTEEDVLTSRRFPDVVCRSIGHDQHVNLKDGVCDVPYGCLVPQKVDGLLVAGRCISTTAPKALDAIRGVVPCISTGQSAGVAAALCAREGYQPRQVPVDILQAALEVDGVML